VDRPGSSPAAVESMRVEKNTIVDGPRPFEVNSSAATSPGISGCNYNPTISTSPHFLVSTASTPHTGTSPNTKPTDSVPPCAASPLQNASQIPVSTPTNNPTSITISAPSSAVTACPQALPVWTLLLLVLSLLCPQALPVWTLLHPVQLHR